MEQIKKLLEVMKKDVIFMEAIQNLAKDGKTGEILGLAAEKGVTITAEDWQSYMDWIADRRKLHKGENLTPEELENITGGHGDKIEYGEDCWFVASGSSEYRDGCWRKKCSFISCTAVFIFHCKCYGTNNCIDAWHRTEGCW